MRTCMSERDIRRLERAIQQQPELIRKQQREEELRRKHEDAEDSQWRKRMLFELWMTLEKLQDRMEKQRDTHEPERTDEEWEDAFCDAIRLIPEARNMARGMRLDFANMKEEEVIKNA